MLSSESSGGSRILKRGFQYVIKVHIVCLLKGSGAWPCKKFGISDLRLFLVYSWGEIAKVGQLKPSCCVRSLQNQANVSAVYVVRLRIVFSEAALQKRGSMEPPLDPPLESR